MAVFKVGIVNKCFEIDGKFYQCGDYDYELTATTFRMWHKLRPGEFKFSKAISACLNGDAANTPFNQTTLSAWLKENFFF